MDVSGFFGMTLYILITLCIVWASSDSHRAAFWILLAGFQRSREISGRTQIENPMSGTKSRPSAGDYRVREGAGIGYAKNFNRNEKFCILEMASGSRG